MTKSGRAICTTHECFNGDICQTCADERFEKALLADDHAALSAECERRLRSLTEGGSLVFRLGPGQPVVWRMPLCPETPRDLWPWKDWADKAATALLHARKRQGNARP